MLLLKIFGWGFIIYFIVAALLTIVGILFKMHGD